ncbi:hypothetical protein, partial [Ligilactobacillus murinus]|uniref:hypothetical protein n=1 Tax=Ligilactobacillus murinus TaxID=1622 RepID=UPI001ED9C5FC
ARKSAHFFPEKRCPKKGYWTWQLAQRPMTTLGGVVVPPNKIASLPYSPKGFTLFFHVSRFEPFLKLRKLYPLGL